MTLVAAGGQPADFYDGIFKIGQGKGAKPLTTLTLVEKLSCPKAGQRDRGGQEEEAAAVGRRQRQVPHQGQAQRGDRGRHEVAGRGPLHVDPDPRGPRQGVGARLRKEEDRDRARRQEVRGQSQETVTWTAVLAGFFVAHMVGDYLLQTDWQARHKAGGLGRDPVARRALLAHVATYTLAFVPALIWIGDELSVGWAVLAGALVALPHLVVDDGRIISLYLTRVKHAEATDARIAGPVDQAFHALSLCIVALLVGAA